MIVGGTDSSIDTTLDVFRPDVADEPLPAVFWVHGGAWISGHKSDVDPHLRILASEGYIDGYEVKASGTRKTLEVKLRYASHRHRVIEGLRRVSRPGKRVYAGAGDLPRVNGGLGVAVISTSQGLLADREARRRHLGGEVVCEVW